MMDEDEEEELLLAAMMRLGARGGAVAGAAAGFAGAGSKGGARGAARGFRWTKKDVESTSLIVPMPAPAAADLVCHVLGMAGDLLKTEEREHGSFAVRTMIGVGLASLNPVVVTAVITGGPNETALVTLRAAAREGLIKQHPAKKALAKVTNLLNAAVA